MELTVGQQSPGLSHDIYNLFYLHWDLQPTAAQVPFTLAGHLWVSALPEGVAVQKARQDGVQDLVRKDQLNKGNCAAL